MSDQRHTNDATPANANVRQTHSAFRRTEGSITTSSTSRDGTRLKSLMSTRPSGNDAVPQRSEANIPLPAISPAGGGTTTDVTTSARTATTMKPLGAIAASEPLPSSVPTAPPAQQPNISRETSGDPAPQRTSSSDYRRFDPNRRNNGHPTTEDDWVLPRQKPKRTFGSIAVAVTTVCGLGIGTALYAGGASFISSLFQSHDPNPTVDNPAYISERPLPPRTLSPLFEGAGRGAAMVNGDLNIPTEPIPGAPPEPNTMIADASEQRSSNKAQTSPPKGHAEPSLERSHRSSSRPSQSTSQPTTTADRTQDRPATRSQKPTATEQKAPNTRAAKENKTAETGKKRERDEIQRYTVQLRATPDKQEADALAKKLKSRGVKGVQVMTAKQNGGQIYRIRINGFASESEAQAAAGKAGYSKAWVTRQGD